MFDSEEFKFDEKEFEDNIKWHHKQMDLMKTIFIIFAVIFVLVFVCICCCRKRNRGRILQPAPAAASNPPVPPGPNVPGAVHAPYPQQQYAAPYPVQVVTAYPVANAAAMPGPYPPGPAPYPANPAPYPAYPAAGMPLPEQSHYPGYPQATPYPTAPSAPSAPDANVFFGIAAPGWNPQALPPSYDQAVCAKPPPHNPYASQ